MLLIDNENNKKLTVIKSKDIIVFDKAAGCVVFMRGASRLYTNFADNKFRIEGINESIFMGLVRLIANLKNFRYKPATGLGKLLAYQFIKKDKI